MSLIQTRIKVIIKTVFNIILFQKIQKVLCQYRNKRLFNTKFNDNHHNLYKCNLAKITQFKLNINKVNKFNRLISQLFNGKLLVQPMLLVQIQKKDKDY